MNSSHHPKLFKFLQWSVCSRGEQYHTHGLWSQVLSDGGGVISWGIPPALSLVLSRSYQGVGRGGTPLKSKDRTLDRTRTGVTPSLQDRTRTGDPNSTCHEQNMPRVICLLGPRMRTFLIHKFKHFRG